MSGLEVERLEIEGVVRLRPRKFTDPRGWFSEIYSSRALADAVGKVEFVQDNISCSARRGTVRGLHFQSAPMEQAKLLCVLKGAVFDVAVDLRPGSPSYGRFVTTHLSARDGTQIFVPRGFAHGFCTLEDDTEVLYKVDAYYSAEHERALFWADDEIGVPWPIDAKDAILSEKDVHAPRLRDLRVN
jgi:dTDP-4-dehydrorhamnose 3,5-epimerase